MLARKLILKVQMTAIFLFSFCPSHSCWVGKPYCLVFFYSALRYKAHACTHACTHTRVHTHPLFKDEKGKRRLLDPGLTIHLFFAPSEGFLSRLWLVMGSVWSSGRLVQMRIQLCTDRALTAESCALAVLTLRSPFRQGTVQQDSHSCWCAKKKIFFFNISAYLCFPLILLRFKGGHWQDHTNRVFTAQQSLEPHLEFYVGGMRINANEKPGQIC